MTMPKVSVCFKSLATNQEVVVKRGSTIVFKT